MSHFQIKNNNNSDWWDQVPLSFKAFLYHNYLITFQKESKIDLIDLSCEHNVKLLRNVSPFEIHAIRKLERIERVNISDGFDWIWDKWYPLRDVSALNFLSNLRQVNFEFNQIENIELSVTNRNLLDLNLYQNRIFDLSFLSCFPNLQRLNLGVNNISNIEPLKQLKQLKYLNLSANHIRDISPIREIEGLNEIDLTQNEIIDKGQIYCLKNLTKISL